MHNKYFGIKSNVIRKALILNDINFFNAKIIGFT